MAALIGLLCSTLLCNKWRVVKNERKENGSSFLSVNIKDTAGCSVLIKQVSVHKQLINKRRPSPPPDVFACLFHFTTGQCYTTAPPEWPQVFIMRTAAAATGTMTQLWHSLTRHGLVFRATFGVSWHISGTDSAHGKNLTRSFLITATLLSACRMWCHHTDGFFGNTSVLMAVISYVLTQLCFIQSVTFQHRINISGTSSTHTSSVVNSSCLSVCLQAPSTWSTSCLMTMCFTCWSPCTARREPTTSWGPWRETAAQVRPLPYHLSLWFQLKSCEDLLCFMLK